MENILDNTSKLRKQLESLRFECNDNKIMDAIVSLNIIEGLILRGALAKNTPTSEEQLATTAVVGRSEQLFCPCCKSKNIYRGEIMNYCRVCEYNWAK